MLRDVRPQVVPRRDGCNAMLMWRAAAGRPVIACGCRLPGVPQQELCCLKVALAARVVQRCRAGGIEGVEVKAGVRIQELVQGLAAAHSCMHEQLMLGICVIETTALGALPMFLPRFICLVSALGFGLLAGLMSFALAVWRLRSAGR